MNLAVYTTLYPGIEPYLADWYRSLQEQTDRQFDLWIGVDQLERQAVERVLGCKLEAQWIATPAGSTPAQVRQQALLDVVGRYDGVVFVDSDDVLLPSRVEAARLQLLNSDLAACALSAIDQDGKDLGFIFGLSGTTDADRVLPKNNVFGFSNSVFRTEILSRCLPIPAETVLVDWHLATKAWLLGARLGFDSTPHMQYRQHANNTARIRGPFSNEQIAFETELVRTHYRLILAEDLPGAIDGRLQELQRVASEIEEFRAQVVVDHYRLSLYVSALNAMPSQPLWWAGVANPALSQMWARESVSICKP